MACKEREAPLFRPWSPKPRAQEPRLVVPEPLYLMPDVFVPSWSWPFHQESVAAAGFEPEAVTRFKSKKQRPKRFQCPHCKVSFSNNGQLKGHVRIHTGRFREMGFLLQWTDRKRGAGRLLRMSSLHHDHDAFRRAFVYVCTLEIHGTPKWCRR